MLRECPCDLGEFLIFIIDGGEETPDLDIASFNLFVRAANTEVPLDGLTNDRIGPWGFGDVVLRVSHEAEFFDKTVS